ncbi:alpha/beta hydrolase [Roseovarius sp. SCSIO 43702]|uniref:alpha/beta hydrolase n=1 Tax=Roseovarius sp. SCSIO 43702 TaxID=2823043 RepID=UPI001C73385A|nr:alpha/beta hydrolase [Roseovarius sp. SCSIO 43702]QYX56497.1 alpha/beta hydrolase [Roseovarius sp. SCSIO 43702]
MSVARSLLNAWLRRVERPHLARAKDPQRLRRSFELKARLFLHGPRGATREEGTLEHGGRQVPALHVRAREAGEGPVVLYLHGGGYVFGSPRTHAAMLATLSREARCRVVLPDYAKAPDRAFPAAVEDALCAYRALEAEPGGVILGGDSAGGGLALAILGEIVRLGLRRPRGLFAFSPLTDMTFSGASLRENAACDAVLPAERAGEMAEMYLAGHDPADPRASPLFAGFAGAPPVWLCVGDTEILRDDARRMAERLRAQGVEVQLREHHDLPHVWPLFHNVLPEGRATLREVAGWIRSL